MKVEKHHSKIANMHLILLIADACAKRQNLTQGHHLDTTNDVLAQKQEIWGYVEFW